VNEEWISDKTRFIWDGLRTPAARPALCARERQAAPGVLGGGLRRDRREGEELGGPERIGAIAGDLAARRGDVRAEGADDPRSARRTSIAARTGGKLDPRSAAPPISSTRPSPGIEQADAILIVGSNPRVEARCSTRASASAGAGRPADRRDRRAGRSHLPYEHLGAAPRRSELAAGRADFAKVLAGASGR
jgi:NADH-quinone oxidoreductase subunit G